MLRKPNTDGIINKLVTVFALSSCPIDRFLARDKGRRYPSPLRCDIVAPPAAALLNLHVNRTDCTFFEPCNAKRVMPSHPCTMTSKTRAVLRSLRLCDGIQYKT